ncbi:hypothetical protein H6B07_04010 [Mediterraneibacter glycyrrhizinilyticus]|nr:hypothetical protein [Mediterraneibacter glycyrrhizinilyticus]MBM6801843.1 hypothetical protein [Mediterraneibacter glycyrrhizinilyticus]
MSFLKKQSVGFYFIILTVILAVAGTIAYLINCGTDYFSNLGINSGIMVCLIIAIILELVMVIGSNTMGQNRLLDLIPVVSGALLMVAFALFVSARVAGIASIMSFERNASTMSDMMSAVVGIVLCFLAVLFNIVGSFFKVVKDEK